MRRLLIAGVGSHNDGDGLGWEALQALRKSDLHIPGYAIEWLEVAHPAVDLLPALPGCNALMVLDALADRGIDARVEVLGLPDLLIDPAIDSHNMGVVPCLQLAQRLGLLPELCLVLGLCGRPELSRMIERVQTCFEV